MKLTPWLVSAALVALPAAARAEPVDVVATFSILGDMVSRVGGERNVETPDPRGRRGLGLVDDRAVRLVAFDEQRCRLAV